MLTCPVCRSQNMDTAKFCGNCGTPFPRSPVPSSSLVNCPQGHIYSAVYEHCPYCPQADKSTTGGFETRIEGTETMIETGGLRPTPPPAGGEFETRLEGFANPFETRIEGGLNVSSFETTLEPSAANEFETRLESGMRAPIENNETVVEMPAPKFDSTDIESTTIMPSPQARTDATVIEEPRPAPAKPAPPKPVEPAPVVPKPVAPKPVVPTPVEPTPPRPTGGIPAQGRTQPNLTPLPPTTPPAPPPIAQPIPAAPPAAPIAAGSTEDADRRTVIMAAFPDAPPAKGKGKIIGWLITYTKDQNGVDYRLYAGFNRIGAHPACDLVIDDDTVSGSHALIVYRDGTCMIKDELSRNGTFLNGAEVSESTALKNYDQVRVGNTILTFISSERPA